MFNSFFKKSKPIKALTEDTFLGALSKDLNEAKEKVAASVETSHEHYESLFSNGLTAFKNFIISEGRDKDSFEQSTKYLVEATELKPSRPEAYYYLACLFHIFDENETALKYLKTVEFINPGYDGIIELKDDITRSFSLNNDV